MSNTIVIAGTDTDIGKTVFATALVGALDGVYWKPIQAGLEGETDSAVVQRLSRLPTAQILPEAYRLKLPASPHLAAEREGVTIDIAKLRPPVSTRALVVELAGGLLVPITREHLQIDIVRLWSEPVILCASTRLGTINHSLLSIEALRSRAVTILGIAFVGDENADTQQTICSIGGVAQLGRLPRLDPLTPDALARAFSTNFDTTALGFGGRASP